MPIFKPSLADNQQLLQQTVAKFANQQIAPLAKQLDESNQFPNHLWRQLGEMDLLGITVEQQYGGAGLGYLEQVLVTEEISRCSASVGLSYAAHANLCVNQINLHANHQQKQKFLPKLLSGQHVGALAISEVGAGSDAMGIQLIAKRQNNEFILNGNKMWITNGPDADIVVLYAKTDPTAGSKGISAFIIERQQSNFTASASLDKLGMRGSNTSELVFNNCRVPAENLIGQIGQGAAILMRGLDYERVVLAAGPLGIMQACLDIVLPYVQQRKQFGKAIGDFQLMQGKIADMYTQLNASRAYLYAIAQSCDQGKISRQDAASVILYTAENATQMALQAIQCLGGNGYTNNYPVARLLRDAKLYEIGAGTSEIRRMLIGRELCNQPC